jgi:hypothetical protein
MEMTRLAGRHLGLLGVHARRELRSRLIDDRGEGVISMAIAVLIVATIGAAMYLLFQGLAESTGNKAEDQINNIG